MKPTENLFLLIKSLSKSEKKYFKRFCLLYSSEKKNNYLKLFEYLDRQNEYNELKLKQYFRNENFIKQLSVLKEYLYKIILKSISIARSSGDLNYELRESVLECEILVSKGLYKQAGKRIRSVKNQLYRYGNYILLLELIGYEKTIISELILTQQEKRLEAIIQEEENILEHIKQIRVLLNLKRELMLILNLFGMPIRNESDIEKVNKMIKTFQDLSVKDNASIQARTILSHSKIAAFISITNYKDAYKESLNLLKILKNNKYINLKDPRNLYGTLHNLVYLSIHLKNKSKALKYLSDLEKYFKTISFKNAIDTYNNIYGNFLILKIIADNRLFNCSSSTDLIKNFIDFYKENRKFLSNDLYINGLSAITANFLNKGNFEKALYYNNNILKNKRTMMSNDMYIIANLNNIILNYELKNYDYVDSQIINFRKYLKSSKYNTDLELLILKYFKQLTNYRNENEKSAILSTLKAKLIELSVNPRVKQILNEYYFIEWIDSRLFSKSMKEIITGRN